MCIPFDQAYLVHQLVASYGLLDQCYYIRVVPFHRDPLRRFHSIDYIDFLHQLSDNEEDHDQQECDAYGLSYDCPPFPRLYETVSYLAASSVAGVQALIHGQCDVVLNWFGGWHHGRSSEASGYCYTNDIVLAILTLLEQGYKRVLYLDLDLHHGDGVEDAFSHTNKVLTLSIHKRETGFFPGTGDLFDGQGKRPNHIINVPLANGITDSMYIKVFDSIVLNAVRKYSPQVILCQCGADTLSGDRMVSFNLTEKTYEHIVPSLLSFNTPIMFLGGGGYNHTNTAKLWTVISGLVLGRSLETAIPEHSYFLSYGPDYELSIYAGFIPNLNDEPSLEEKVAKVESYIASLS